VMVASNVLLAVLDARCRGRPRYAAVTDGTSASAAALAPLQAPAGLHSLMFCPTLSGPSLTTRLSLCHGWR
jgi:hypothetical protein